MKNLNPLESCSIVVFGDTQSVLAVCEELLLEHQSALMRKNAYAALLYYEQFFHTRRLHLLHVVDRWLPLYAKLYPQQPAGGKAHFIRREAQTILKHTKKYLRLFSRNALHPESLKLDLVRLFEEYIFLKDLLDHHDARETKIMFPYLDKKIDKDRRKTLLVGYLEEMSDLWKSWDGIDV